MIVILLKAGFSAVALYFAYSVGRASVVREICEWHKGKRKNLSDDILRYCIYYNKNS